ncbi:MAG TPA: haloacid dehalogenase-like hydrolase [Vicinamibacterales bacterium]|nr:haloacid dehalogenase-like hydrolase [Vicinamibacterales bacterium]
MTSPRTLVLFDIDGTLVHTGRAGLRGMNAAIGRLFGRAGAMNAVPFAGRTDRAIVSDVLRQLGRGIADEDVFHVRQAYLEDLAIEITRPPVGDFGVLPGIAPLLDALHADPAVVVALLTGNFEGGAAIKLGHFDLWRRFDFGAFGDHHEDRRCLVPVALERARDISGLSFAPARVVVIGDTPLDVDCARAHGARAIAVATGPFGVEALAEAGAHLAVESLEDTTRVVEWVRQ